MADPVFFSNGQLVGHTGAPLDISDLVAAQPQDINAQTGTSYTIHPDDLGKLVTLSNGSAIALTLPADADCVFPIGGHVDLLQLGAGQVTSAAGSNATQRNSGLTGKFRAQYSKCRVQKIAADVWSFSGDIATS